MKTILITGLDGSGKSTLLAKLAAQMPANTGFVYLPQIETECLLQTPDLHEAATFVNKLGQEADERQVPQLKAVALFAAMLLFKKLLAQNLAQACTTVFCERHPLIDTGVYAKFYAEKLTPGCLSNAVLDALDQQHGRALDYLISLLPKGAKADENSKLAILLGFIYQWFHLEKKTDVTDLAALFGVGLPEKIYYLSASPSVLFGRIKHRGRLEAHESEAVFERLEMAYGQVMEALASQQPGLVEIVDANQVERLDLLFEEICNDYL